MTYEIDGEQYVSVLSGWGSTSNLIYGVALDKPVSAEPGRVITFKLGGTAEMPNPLEYNVVETPKQPLLVIRDPGSLVCNALPRTACSVTAPMRLGRVCCQIFVGQPWRLPSSLGKRL